MSEVPIVVLAGQSNAHFGGIDNKVVERLTETGNAFEFVKLTLPGASMFVTPDRPDFDPSSGELFTDMVNATLAAMANAVAQGQTPKVTLLLAQGETDQGRPVATYAQKMTEFIAAFRQAIGMPDAEIYLSMLPNPVPGRTAQLQVAATVPGVFTIDTAGLNRWDASHFDHAGREYIGNTFMDMSGIAAPTIDGYDNLLADTAVSVSGNTVTVTGALYTDVTFVGDDRPTNFNSYSGDDVVRTGAGADFINTGDNDDRIYGGAGNDYVNAGPGDDYVEGGTGDDYLNGLLGLDRIYGGAGNDRLFGYTQDDYLDGGDGNDALDGGTGIDTLVGGLGDDIYYVDDSADKIIELPGEGNDSVFATATYDLAGQAVESLKLTGSTNINAFGNELANSIVGNGGNNILDGRGGADTMNGLIGDDFYFVDDAGDVVIEAANAGIDTVQSTVDYALTANVEKLILSGAAYRGTGNALGNSLTGTSADNLLDGAAGADFMTGNGGNDTYIVDDAGDMVIEAVGGGNDIVRATISYSLASNVERLTLDGVGNIAANGNTLDNVLTGNSGDNTLNGGTGADTMIGGGGNDTYFIDNAGDRIIEEAGGGTDLVRSSISYTLGAELERLTLDGTANLVATGNGLANLLTGNSGNNTLNGKAGADIMVGGDGGDTYYVDDAGDVVIETQVGVIDLVRSTISYTIGANVERLVLDGFANINGFGNELDNLLTGNAGDNLLDGKAGADFMNGNGGNDTYFVDNLGDRVIETAGGGIDTVRATISYTLGSELEWLALEGTANINATGNALDNRLIGNSGNNTLNGKAGADTMAGGDGGDTYYVDDAGDVVVETQAGVIDLVHSTISYTLGDNVERLTLGGVADIDATGNELANRLTGNAGDNVLDGRGGRDVLTGGGGDDLFFFGSALVAGSLGDIADFTIGEDRIALDQSVFAEAGGVGALATNAFVQASLAQDADDRVIYDRASGNLFFDRDGTGAATQILFAHVTAGIDLGAGSFTIV